MKPIILGGGLAGLSLAYFLKGNSIILEKEKKPGGLCRSFKFNNFFYDIGTHTMFSKDREILNLLASLTKTHRIVRSNKIYHNGKLIRYPFEGNLADLDDKDREYCLREFLHNPYERYLPQNLLQFFLKTFGEGITNLNLRPYNQKVWKLDPAYLDMSVAERISKTPSTKSTRAEAFYPDKGGIQRVIDAFLRIIDGKSKVICPIKIKSIHKKKGLWLVKTNKGDFSSKLLISCMPLPELFRLIKAPAEITRAVNELKYNSIYIVTVQAKRDKVGDNLALYFADKDIIFNRISRLNFLGKNYCPADNNSVLSVEITYRPQSYLDTFKKEEIKKMVINDLDKLNLVKKEDVVDVDFRSFAYAYVVYSLNYKKNKDRVLKYLSNIGIHCCGRSAEFQYLDMDAVVEHSRKLAKKLDEE